jgi:hypothetical protein
VSSSNLPTGHNRRSRFAAVTVDERDRRAGLADTRPLL